MNPDRFTKDAPGRLVQVQHGDGPYWAFIPDPLPPALAVDGEVARLAEEAAHALGELSGLGRALPNPYLLLNPSSAGRRCSRRASTARERILPTSMPMRLAN